MLGELIKKYKVETIDGVTEWLRDEYSFRVLTGEACALSMRMLVELKDAEITRLYQEFLGIYFEIDQRGFGNTIFMTWKMIEEFAIFVLCNRYGLVVKASHRGFDRLSYWLCFENADDYYAMHKEAVEAGLFDKFVWSEEDSRYTITEGVYETGRTYTTGSNPRRGMSNVHAMTGVSQ